MSLSLSFVRGEAYEAIGSHKNEAGTGPEDITGWTIVLTARKQPHTAGAPILQLTAQVIDGPQGQYRFAMTSTETKAIRSTVDPLTGKDVPYACDIWRTDTGFEKRMADGVLHVDKGVLYQ